MVGLIVHLMRRNVEKEEDMKNIFNSAFSAHQWGVSAVPADGLFLERLFFDGYNRKAERMSSAEEYNMVEKGYISNKAHWWLHLNSAGIPEFEIKFDGREKTVLTAQNSIYGSWHHVAVTYNAVPPVWPDG